MSIVCDRCEGEGEIHDADFSDGDSDKQMFIKQDTLRPCPKCTQKLARKIIMFGIIKESSYSYDGGHGYGIMSSKYKEFIPFKSEQELTDWIKQNHREKYTVIKYEDVEVEVKMVVKTKPVVRNGGIGGAHSPKCTCPDC